MDPEENSGSDYESDIDDMYRPNDNQDSE